MGAIVETGRCICVVVVFNGSLYSRVYGIGLGQKFLSSNII